MSGFDFGSLKGRKVAERIVDPIKLFQSLHVNDSNINDLWLAQGDALRQWHDSREMNDISVELNTGAGKTLVGLLIAQSLVNETNSLVLYACGSIQLVRQTEEKAAGYGLRSTTYITGNFSNELAESGLAPCLTTYQALFNGKSIFRNREVSAVIFDDAHVAEHILRDAFSLKLARDTFTDETQALLSLFENHFVTADRAASFHEIKNGDGTMLLVPPWEVKATHDAILRILGNSQVPKLTDTLFSWEHLKDNLDLCAVTLTGTEITFSPPFLPTSTLPYFGKNCRRLYLSATMKAPDVFARTFGRVPKTVISPSTTAGECERMILIPQRITTKVEDEIALVAKSIDKHKALILVPSYRRALKWESVAVSPEKTGVAEAVEKFKSAKPPTKLILTARYDGVDLPGEMCRVLVIDELPASFGALDRFLWEFLHQHRSFRSSVACRITQSFGRISRGMSDHGVVFITGKNLVEWLRVPENRAALPEFLQRQLELGRNLSDNLSPEQMVDATGICLARDPGWIESYTDNMSEKRNVAAQRDKELSLKLALAESRFIGQLWKRDYSQATLALQSTIDDVSDFSLGTLGWHLLWCGYAHQLNDDTATADKLFRRASSCNRNLPRTKSRSKQLTGERSQQARAIASCFDDDGNGGLRAPTQMAHSFTWLSSEKTSGQVEEALRSVGRYLGLDSTRPDKEVNTGPDVLWIGEDQVAICMDAKTEKKPKSKYNKEEIGQMHDHVEWVTSTYPASTIVPCFVGSDNSATESSNPSTEMVVCPLAEFAKLASDIQSLYTDVSKNAVLSNLEEYIDGELERRNLKWPDVFHSLAQSRLVDL